MLDLAKNTESVREQTLLQMLSGSGELDHLRGFISSLDQDWERAGHAYELIRRNLITYFRGRQCPNAEDLADEAIDRAARKHQEARDLPRFVRVLPGGLLQRSFERLRRFQWKTFPSPVRTTCRIRNLTPTLIG